MVALDDAWMVESSAVLFASLGLTIAGVIKGATGLGYASCALPFLTLVVGLKAAMAIVIAPALATNISLSLTIGNVRGTVSRFWWLYLSMLPGIAVGLWLLIWVPAQWAVHTLGVVIISYVVLALTRPDFAIPARLERPLQVPVGFLNGVVTGLTGAQVMPLFPYILGLRLDPDRTVQAVNVAVLIATTVLAIGLLQTGIMTPVMLAASLTAVVPALVGVALGNRARRLIPVDRFRRLVLLALSLVGTLMLVR